MMTCGHPEVATIPELCEFGGEYETICLPLLEFNFDETDACEGVMCGPRQVELGNILDNLVVDVEGSRRSTDELALMTGGLNIDAVEEISEAVWDDLKYDVDEYHEIFTFHDHDMGSGGPFNSESENRSDETVLEIEINNDMNMEDVEGFAFAEDFMQEIWNSENGENISECSSCKHFKQKQPLLSFMDFVSPWLAYETSTLPEPKSFRPVFAGLTSRGVKEAETSVSLGEFA